MHRSRLTAVVVAAFVFSGCYHATVRTGVRPGAERVTRPMASGWVFGLVPPSTVDAEEDCGDTGVALVETQHSFANQLVGVLTLGIFTPMTIVVTCGDGSPGGQPESLGGQSESPGGQPESSDGKLESSGSQSKS